MEHSLHLTAKHFVKSITPLSCKNSDSPMVHTGDPASDYDSDDDDDENLDSGDSLWKAIALVKQVRILSPCCCVFRTHTKITDP